MRLHSISIRWKLLILVGIMMLSILSAYLLSLQYSYHDLLTSRKTTLKSVVDNTVNQLSVQLESASSQAQQLTQARHLLNALRFDQDNYLFIVNQQGVCLVHPTMPELEGKNLNQIFDSKHQPAFQQMLNALHGDHFWRFFWPRPGSNPTPIEKLVYVAPLPTTDWLVGTGLYLDDLHTTLQQRSLTYSLITLCSLLLAYMLASRIGQSISRPAQRIVHAIEQIRHRQFEGDIQDARRGDELGQIAKALLLFREQAKENSQLRQANAQARYLQTFDPDTQLMTRKAMVETLATQLNQTDTRCAIILIKIPLLRDILAQWGTTYCNRVLNCMIERFNSCLTEADILARHSDDTLAIIRDLRHTDGSPTALVQSLQTLIMQPLILDDQQLTFRSRSGISHAPEDGRQELLLISHAEEALSEARRLELDYMFFNQLRTFALDERLELWKDIQQALRDDQFYLVFQPLFDLRSHRLVSAEVLLRWQHPTQGFIPPGRFVTFAEQSGLMSLLDSWVIQATARQLRRWRQQGIEPPRLAINLSGLTFMRSDLSSLLQHVSHTYQTPLELLELELTEGVLIEALETLQARIDSIRATGIRIAIDDFGTGYSSLSRIRTLNINSVKIDRAFIEHLSQHPGDQKVVRAIIDMAQGMGFSVVAEGVETPEQLAVLRRLNCDIVQGFLLARPMPASQFATLLERQNIVIELD